MNRFFALSRTKHGILDIATPAFCALLWLGHFPSIEIIALGLFTAFSGYTAIYALNDLIGYKSDKEKFSGKEASSSYSVEATNFHHPLAQNFLSLKSGILWIVFWISLSFIGSIIRQQFACLLGFQCLFSLM